VALRVAVGALGVMAMVGFVPKQVGEARPSTAAGLTVVNEHGGALRGGASKQSVVPINTNKTLHAQSEPAEPSPSPSPTRTTVPGSSGGSPAPSPAQPSAPDQPSGTQGILPPQNPQANIPPSPDFLQSCSGSQYDDSATCVSATLDAIANGRQAEGLPAMSLPANWQSLTPEQQLFVATDLERTARGLPAITGMASVLDQAAQAAAAADADPSPPTGFGFVAWAGNWAGAVGNPLEAIYYWMYDDGPGSANVDCSSTDSAGCWGHRDNVLAQISCLNCVMGTGYVPNAYRGTPSWAELIVEATVPTPLVFSWQQEQE
jgi:hypothetical protein